MFRVCWEIPDIIEANNVDHAANTKTCWSSGGLLSDQRRRRRTDSKLAQEQYVEFLGTDGSSILLIQCDLLPSPISGKMLSSLTDRHSAT